MCVLAFFLWSCGSLWEPFWTPWPTIWAPWPTIWVPWVPSWASESLLGRPWAPIWASIGRPDPPLRPFGGAIASMNAAWTSKSTILERSWLHLVQFYNIFGAISLILGDLCSLAALIPLIAPLGGAIGSQHPSGTSQDIIFRRFWTDVGAIWVVFGNLCGCICRLS